MYLTSKAEVTLEWADGEYPFALKGKQIEELQARVKNLEDILRSAIRK